MEPIEVLICSAEKDHAWYMVVNTASCSSAAIGALDN